MVNDSGVDQIADEGWGGVWGIGEGEGGSCEQHTRARQSIGCRVTLCHNLVSTANGVPAVGVLGCAGWLHKLMWGSIMISEKTVELNLTCELMNYFYKHLGRRVFSIGPSSIQEASFPYDAYVGLPATGFFIQYKRAYVTKDHWKWYINHTKAEDQHRKLQQMQTRGLDVYYALPMFHTPTELTRYRGRLLLQTLWPEPNNLSFPGGPIGRHTIHYNSSKNAFWMTSDEEKPIERPSSFDDVIMKMLNNSKPFSYLFPKLIEIFKQSEGVEDFQGLVIFGILDE